MSERYLNQVEVIAKYGVSRSTFYDRIRDGSIPKPTKLGGVNRWRESLIDAHIRQSHTSDLVAESGAEK